MFNKNYTHDLQFGEMKEKELADILLNQKIEVKTDRKWNETGNIAVEFMSRGKKSGISITEAKYWAFILDNDNKIEGIIILPIDRLKQLSREYYSQGKITKGGDDNTSDMVLIPLKEIWKKDQYQKKKKNYTDVSLAESGTLRI